MYRLLSPRSNHTLCQFRILSIDNLRNLTCYGRAVLDFQTRLQLFRMGNIGTARTRTIIDLIEIKITLRSTDSKNRWRCVAKLTTALPRYSRALKCDPAPFFIPLFKFQISIKWTIKKRLHCTRYKIGTCGLRVHDTQRHKTQLEKYTGTTAVPFAKYVGL